jgi:hypothetical protein
MRPHQTAGEASSIAALIEAFHQGGHRAELVPRAIQDRPDALLKIAGHAVACECIQIPPSSILQHLHRRPRASDWQGESILSRVWPNEPHQWVAEAIRKKSALVPGYLTATGASEAWLLVHTAPEQSQFFLDTSKEWIQFAVRHGASMEPHPFSQVHVWTPQHGIFSAWSRAEHDRSRTSLEVAFTDGYPTLCSNQFSVPFRTLGPGAMFVREVRGVLSGHQVVVVPPMDADYQLHMPALREASYAFTMAVYRTRAVLTFTSMFRGEPDLAPQPLMVMKDLAPSTDCWFHVVHEFGAPKRLKTWHHVDARESGNRTA